MCVWVAGWRETVEVCEAAQKPGSVMAEETSVSSSRVGEEGSNVRWEEGPSHTVQGTNLQKGGTISAIQLLRL